MAGDTGEEADILDILIKRAEQEVSKEGFEEPDWEELKHHPMFAEGDIASDHPVAEALAALDLEELDPEGEAQEAKKQGNFYFKCKKYRNAVNHYTEGIKKKSPNKETNAQLLSNRAAAHSHLGNHRSAVLDCALACKLKPHYNKAIIRGIESCMALCRGDDAVRWCDRALMADPGNETLLELRKNAAILKTKVEKDERKERMKERKIRAVEHEIISAIQERKIRIAGAEKENLTLQHLETQHPSGARVFVGEDKSLYWPVVFVYPEFRQTDSISAFNENHRFMDHLEVILGDSNPPPTWDPCRRYRPDTVELYFEDKENIKLWRIKPTSTLRSVLSNQNMRASIRPAEISSEVTSISDSSETYLVHDGTPSFLVLVKDSSFAEQFLGQYTT